ncbi:DUF2268 domain-containing putative Zn-dependent protease [Candidatus Nanohalococcus occultus]|uniref:DUF2268 domain-containing protein n=1 Tax=Candidatus Nanohalococcus occultus TaxID=2978047 RepID=A0ABY8CJS4_9ARCH|nr:hypothetical protein SVXNc_0568 [Candidatus Nanohaloarchaeota archaeon SVXNc]
MSHQIKPSTEELEEAKEIVDVALSEAEEKLPMEQEVIVELGWTESDFTIEEMDGSSGFAKYPNVIDLSFNNSADKWKESLRAQAFHEYAHTWDYEKRGQQWDTRWEYILGEALTQHFAEQNAEYESPWRTKIGREDIAEHWSKIRDEELDQEFSTDQYDPIFINKGDGEYPNWLGYTLSYQIGEQLLQDHSLEDFPELEKEDVVEAGNEIYSET